MHQDHHTEAMRFSASLGHPGVVAMMVAGFSIAVMLLVDHGPWSRAKMQPAHVAMYKTTGEAAGAAGALVLPTPPKSPIEPAQAGPKISPAVNPASP